MQGIQWPRLFACSRSNPGDIHRLSAPRMPPGVSQRLTATNLRFGYLSNFLFGFRIEVILLGCFQSSQVGSSVLQLLLTLARLYFALLAPSLHVGTAISAKSLILADVFGSGHYFDHHLCYIVEKCFVGNVSVGELKHSRNYLSSSSMYMGLGASITSLHFFS